MESRRQYERFPISEDAVALDEQGRVLGKVTVVGGGGMAIRLDDPQAIRAGQQLHVTVLEPDLDIRHSVGVVVRYVNGNTAGVEFLTGKAERAE